MSIGRELLDFYKDWRLDGDLIVCQHCNRGLHVTRTDEKLHHSSECPLHGKDHDDPWQKLRALLGVEVVDNTQVPEDWSCPDRCPITMDPFFMWIHHPEKGWVPTYGGPYDSYTIPEPTNLPEKGAMEFHDIELCRHRYDHDEGGWLIEEVEDTAMRVILESNLVELLDKAGEL